MVTRPVRTEFARKRAPTRLGKAHRRTAERHTEKNEIGNVGIGGWANVFGDDVAASAIADRVCHHCTLIKITGRSYRLKDLPADKRKEY